MSQAIYTQIATVLANVAPGLAARWAYDQLAREKLDEATLLQRAANPDEPAVLRLAALWHWIHHDQVSTQHNVSRAFHPLPSAVIDALGMLPPHLLGVLALSSEARSYREIARRAIQAALNRDLPLLAARIAAARADLLEHADIWQIAMRLTPETRREALLLLPPIPETLAERQSIFLSLPPLVCLRCGSEWNDLDPNILIKAFSKLPKHLRVSALISWALPDAFKLSQIDDLSPEDIGNYGDKILRNHENIAAFIEKLMHAIHTGESDEGKRKAAQRLLVLVLLKWESALPVEMRKQYALRAQMQDVARAIDAIHNQSLAEAAQTIATINDEFVAVETYRILSNRLTTANANGAHLLDKLIANYLGEQNRLNRLVNFVRGESRIKQSLFIRAMAELQQQKTVNADLFASLQAYDPKEIRRYAQNIAQRIFNGALQDIRAARRPLHPAFVEAVYAYAKTYPSAARIFIGTGILSPKQEAELLSHASIPEAALLFAVGKLNLSTLNHYLSLRDAQSKRPNALQRMLIAAVLPPTPGRVLEFAKHFDVASAVGLFAFSQFTVYLWLAKLAWWVAKSAKMAWEAYQIDLKDLLAREMILKAQRKARAARFTQSTAIIAQTVVQSNVPADQSQSTEPHPTSLP